MYKICFVGSNRRTKAGRLHRVMLKSPENSVEELARGLPEDTVYASLARRLRKTPVQDTWHYHNGSFFICSYVMKNCRGENDRQGKSLADKKWNYSKTKFSFCSPRASIKQFEPRVRHNNEKVFDRSFGPEWNRPSSQMCDNSHLVLQTLIHTAGNSYLPQSKDDAELWFDPQLDLLDFYRVSHSNNMLFFFLWKQLGCLRL